MKFNAAMTAAKKGKKVTRDGKSNILAVGSILMRERGKKSTEARFTQDDIDGDWKVVKEITVKATAKKKKVSKKKKAA
jgi:hypothetical protein